MLESPKGKIKGRYRKESSSHGVKDKIKRIRPTIDQITLVKIQRNESTAKSQSLKKKRIVHRQYKTAQRRYSLLKIQILHNSFGRIKEKKAIAALKTEIEVRSSVSCQDLRRRGQKRPFTKSKDQIFIIFLREEALKAIIRRDKRYRKQLFYLNEEITQKARQCQQISAF